MLKSFEPPAPATQYRRNRVTVGGEHAVFPSPVGVVVPSTEDTHSERVSRKAVRGPVRHSAPLTLHMDTTRTQPPPPPAPAPPAAAAAAVFAKAATKLFRPGVDAHKALGAADRRGTGKLSYRDLQRALAHVGLPLTSAAYDAIAAQQGRNPDDGVNYRAFLADAKAADTDVGTGLALGAPSREFGARRGPAATVLESGRRKPVPVAWDAFQSDRLRIVPPLDGTSPGSPRKRRPLSTPLTESQALSMAAVHAAAAESVPVPAAGAGAGPPSPSKKRPLKSLPLLTAAERASSATDTLSVTGLGHRKPLSPPDPASTLKSPRRRRMVRPPVSSVQPPFALQTDLQPNARSAQHVTPDADVPFAEVPPVPASAPASAPPSPTSTAHPHHAWATSRPDVTSPVAIAAAAARRREALVAEKLTSKFVEAVHSNGGVEALADAILSAGPNQGGTLSVDQLRTVMRDVGLESNASDAAVVARTLGARAPAAADVSGPHLLTAVDAALARQQRSGSSVPATPVLPTTLQYSSGAARPLVYGVDGVQLGRRGGAGSRASQPAASDVSDIGATAPSTPYVGVDGVVLSRRGGAHHRAAVAAAVSRKENEPATRRAQGSMRPVGGLEVELNSGGAGDQLADLRQTIRDALPSSRPAAATALRHALRRLDGDRDGKVTARELAKALAAVGAPMHATDVRRVSAAAAAMDAAARQKDKQQRRVFESDWGVVDIDRFTEFVVDAVGGHGVPGYEDVGAWQWLANHSADPRTAPQGDRRWATTSSEVGSEARAGHKSRRREGHPVEYGQWAASTSGAGGGSSHGTPSSSQRSDWLVKDHKLLSFRAAWEDRHGAPAAKELAADAARVPPGPTWSSANPRPFRVVRLAQGPPLPAPTAAVKSGE